MTETPHDDDLDIEGPNESAPGSDLGFDDPEEGEEDEDDDDGPLAA